MTEQEWLAAADPTPMLESLDGKTSDRKLRLFGVASIRLVWNELSSDVLRRATETCERFADGHATEEQLREAREMARANYEGIGDIISDHSTLAVAGLCSRHPRFEIGEGCSGGIAAVAAEAWSNQYLSFYAALRKAEEIQCKLLHDIFGNPFRPVALNHSWLTSTVVALANGIYSEKAFDRMPILADALQDAGCDSEDILNHCRQPGEHVRGCWVVDLLLGK